VTEITVRVEAEILNDLMTLMPETKGLTYSGLVDMALRLLIEKLRVKKQ